MRTSVFSAGLFFFIGASGRAEAATSTTSAVSLEDVCADEIAACSTGSPACFTCLLALSQVNATVIAAELPSDVTCEETPAILCNYVETGLGCDTTDDYVLSLAACITVNEFNCEFDTCDFTPAPITVTGAPTSAGTSIGTSAPSPAVTTAPTGADGSRSLDSAAPTAAPTTASTTASTSGGTVEGLATPSPADAGETGESASNGAALSLDMTLMRGSVMGICALVAAVGALVA